MLKPGTYIKMTKGYKETKGVVTERTKSRFELYILKLNNGLNIIAGPSAFVPLKSKLYITNPFKNEEERS